MVTPPGSPFGLVCSWIGRRVLRTKLSENRLQTPLGYQLLISLNSEQFLLLEHFSDLQDLLMEKVYEVACSTSLMIIHLIPK